MNDVLDVLRDVTQLLGQEGIPYRVTGSIALNYFAIPRMTRDIDVMELMPKDVTL